MKRFTDMVVKSLLNVSPLHNKELELLLAAMLKELPATPVKGLKKLLEIYLEVVRLNGGTAQDEAVKAKLVHWKDNNALSKLVKAAEG